MQNVYLIGAEEVSRAANTMRSAAEQMSRVATNIDGSLERFQRFMEDWLVRFEQANNIYLEALEQERQNHSQFGVGS